MTADLPDVRWEGVSHDQIVRWVHGGRGAKVTEILEDRLKSAAEALADTADSANSVLQRVNGGEWTGNAATAAAQATQVLRDFDDSMGHNGKANHLAAFGQSDNASWAKASVPPVVDVSTAPQVPVGDLNDLFHATEDFQHQQQAAHDAEQEARRVMREYETMSTGRIAALPPISPAPQVVVVPDGDSITVEPGPGDGEPRRAYIPPPVTKPDAGGDPVPGHREPTGGGSQAGDDASASQPQAGGSGTAPSETTPSGTTSTHTPFPAGGGTVTEPPRNTTTPVGGPGTGTGSPRQGGTPVGTGPREPGARSGVGTRGVAGEVAARGGTATRGGGPGVAPVGGAGRGQSEEDKEHQVKYGVPGSEIFEPENDDGLWYDPFRPGSFIAPATIGDEDDE